MVWSLQVTVVNTHSTCPETPAAVLELSPGLLQVARPGLDLVFSSQEPCVLKQDSLQTCITVSSGVN